MSKYTDTEYNRFKRVESQLQSIYSSAIAFRLTADAITEKLRTMYQTADYQRLSKYYRCYIAGLHGGHYWTDDNGQPTDRPFTEYKPTN